MGDKAFFIDSCSAFSSGFLLSELESWGRGNVEVGDWLLS